MKSASIILAALATSIQARSIVLGDFEVANPFSSGLSTQPQVWLNGGSGVSPDSPKYAVGKATDDGGNGQLCAGQSCPMSFSFALCSGQILSSDGNSARINVKGPGYNTVNMSCGRNTGFTQGSIFDGRFQSWYRCDLGDAQC